MFKFKEYRSKEITIDQLFAPITKEQLAPETNAMVDRMLELIADCTDADVVFQPVDPEADDPYAADEADTDLAWRLGHVIVHATASAEESAFLAAEQARGVDYHGRSRYEIPWESVTTIAQCRARLEESRRMRLASLEMWPDEPHMDNVVSFQEDGPTFDPIARFVIGLLHDYDHLGQIEEIVRQAQAARAG